MIDWTTVVRAVADPRGKKPDPQIVAMIADHADEQFETWSLTTLRRQAALLAHVCVETSNFTALEENLNYTTAERIREVWPKRFPTIASATPFVRNPRALAIKVYGARNGNRPGTDDGWIFRGKGPLQATGRDKTTLLAERLGVTPDIAAAWLIHPDHALECACALFVLLDAVPAADSGDIVAQTKKINGGKNGLAERQAAYQRAVRALTREAVRARIDANDDDAAGEPVTARDLRAAGSRTIKGADQAQQGVVGAVGAIGGATAALSQVKDVADQAQEAATAIQSGVSALEALRTYWPLLAVLGLSAVAAYFVWRAWRGAAIVKAARVDDAACGLNVGR